MLPESYLDRWMAEVPKTPQIPVAKFMQRGYVYMLFSLWPLTRAGTIGSCGVSHPQNFMKAGDSVKLRG